MKKLFYTFLFIGCLSTSMSYSQDHLYSLEYSVGMGNDFVEKPSFRGLAFEYRNMVNSNIGVGFGMGYNFFYEEKDYDTYVDGNASISGIQYRYLHNIPLMASVDYYFKPKTKINPFVGFGIGGNYILQRVDMGVFTSEDEAFQFAFRPEAGVIFAAGPNTDLVFAAKYLIGSGSNSLDGQSYLALNLGFIFF
jgi:opacity protein-like surface antigen